MFAAFDNPGLSRIRLISFLDNYELCLSLYGETRETKSNILIE